MTESESSPDLHRESGAFRFGVASEAHAEHPERNEDASFADAERGVFAVFDGIGGQAAGDKASQLAREILTQRVTDLPTERDAAAAREWLVTTMQLIDHEIHQAGKYPHPHTNMGTTGTVLVTAQIEGKTTGLVGTSGDTRLWLLREHALKQQTVDNASGTTSDQTVHFLRDAQEKINQVSNLDELNALPDPLPHLFRSRNFVENDLGDDRHNPRIESFELQPNDRLLLTSDGIHDNLTSDEVASILTEIHDPEDAARQLVWRSQQVSQTDSIRAKPDDMTALVVDWAGK